MNASDIIEAITLTLEENAHLADGDVCTLSRLKIALRYNPKLTGAKRPERNEMTTDHERIVSSHLHSEDLCKN